MGHFDSIVPSLACIPTKQHGICGAKYLLKTPGNVISETLNFKMSLDSLALRNLCLWFEFQSCLQFIISLLMKKIFDSLDPTLLAESFFHLLDFGVLKKDCMSSISLYMHLLHVARIQAKQPHASYSRLSLMTIALSINCFSHLKRQFEQ